MQLIRRVATCMNVSPVRHTCTQAKTSNSSVADEFLPFYDVIVSRVPTVVTWSMALTFCPNDGSLLQRTNFRLQTKS